MANTPVLALPHFKLPFAVETDAFDMGVGAVLAQEGHPVAYMSKALEFKIVNCQFMKRSSWL